MYLTTKSYAGVSFIARVLTSISPNYSNLNNNLPKWEKHRIRMKQTVVFINIRRIVVISCSDSSCYSNFENINKIRLKKLDEQQFFFSIWLYTPYFHFTYIKNWLGYIQEDIQVLSLSAIRKLDDSLLRGVGVFLVVHWGQGR